MTAPRILIIFRFHHRFEVVADRLRWLRVLNPGAQIVGFYGGPSINRKAALALEWDDCYVLKDKIDLWKWQYGDMHLRKWFRSSGHRLNFDFLCLAEWDLVFTRPLMELYQPDQHALLMTDVKSLEQRRAENWTWLTEPYVAPEREAFEAWARKKLGWDGRGNAGLLPGALVRRDLLEAYARVNPPRGGNDELRLGILAAAWGFSVGETNFRQSESYNCDRREIPVELVIQKARDNQASVFHPVYQEMGDDNLRGIEMGCSTPQANPSPR